MWIIYICSSIKMSYRCTWTESPPVRMSPASKLSIIIKRPIVYNWSGTIWSGTHESTGTFFLALDFMIYLSRIPLFGNDQHILHLNLNVFDTRHISDLVLIYIIISDRCYLCTHVPCTNIQNRHTQNIEYTWLYHARHSTQNNINQHRCFFIYTITKCRCFWLLIQRTRNVNEAKFVNVIQY